MAARNFETLAGARLFVAHLEDNGWIADTIPHITWHGFVYYRVVAMRPEEDQEGFRVLQEDGTLA